MCSAPASNHRFVARPSMLRNASTLVSLGLLIGILSACTRRNPDVCCATDMECRRLGLTSEIPCELGVCVDNVCSSAEGMCDGDEDCGDGVDFCVEGRCAACRESASCAIDSPVCDVTRHECRGCEKDSECASLACDLFAGTCIDKLAILYAGPLATSSAPCSRTAPCSFEEAATKIDAQHSHIVLLPGNHGGAFFQGKRAIVIGTEGAVLTRAGLSIREGSVVTLRSIKVREAGLDSLGAGFFIASFESELTIEDSELASFAGLISASPRLTILRSKITDGFIHAEHSIIIERTMIGPASPTRLSGTQGGSSFAVIANSVFLAPAGRTTLDLYSTFGTGSAFVSNNTFIGGQIHCTGDFSPKKFDSNIFYNIELIDPPGPCSYEYNLSLPELPLNGASNITSDPMFIDASTNDFRLKPGSPAVDAGNTGAVESLDFLGTPRPQGARVDIGALEYQPSP